MTTQKAASQYLAQHLATVQGRKVVVYNPNNLNENDLPIIYGFNSGGSIMPSATAIAEDGTLLVRHSCNDESYMPADLGIIEGTALSRHELEYQPHYPNGYRMEFVPSESVIYNRKLQMAFEKHYAKECDESTYFSSTRSKMYVVKCM